MLTFQNLHLIVAVLGIALGGAYYVSLPEPIVVRAAAMAGETAPSGHSPTKVVRIVY